MSIQSSITTPLSLTALLFTQSPGFKRAAELAQTRATLGNLQKQQESIKGAYAAASTSEDKATTGEVRIEGAERQTAAYGRIADITGKEKDVEKYVSARQELSKLREDVSTDVRTLANTEAEAEATELSRRVGQESYEAGEVEGEGPAYFDFDVEGFKSRMAMKKADQHLAQRQEAQRAVLARKSGISPEALAAYNTIYNKKGGNK